MLHIVNKSSFERNSLKAAINLIDDKGIILLTEDGVISATNTKSKIIIDLANNGRVYALKGDLDARGLSTKLVDGIKTIDYTGFVSLVVKYGTPVSWL